MTMPLRRARPARNVLRRTGRWGRWGVAALLLAAACDDFPGSEVIGVRLTENEDGIQVTKVLCQGDRVTRVSLLAENNLDGEALWKITSDTGSNQETYIVGTTPPGFVEEVPLTRPLGPTDGLAVTIATEGEAPALKTFEIRELRNDKLFTPDGYLTPELFEARHLERCAD